jgi:hypothetical protein
MAIFVIFGCLCLAGAGVLKKPKVFSDTARLELNTGLQDRRQATSSDPNITKAQRTHFESEAVLHFDRVVQQYNLEKNNTDFMSRALSLVFPGADHYGAAVAQFQKGNSLADSEKVEDGITAYQAYFPINPGGKGDQYSDMTYFNTANLEILLQSDEKKQDEAQKDGKGGKPRKHGRSNQQKDKAQQQLSKPLNDDDGDPDQSQGAGKGVHHGI